MIQWLKKIMSKAVIIAIVFVLGAISGGMIAWSYSKRSQDKAVIKYQDKELKAVEKIHERKEKRTERLQKTREVILNVKDDSKCSILDTPVPDAFADGMRDFYRRGAN